MPAGIAAPRPAAVAMSASEMPGATTARLAGPCEPMPRNALMMPQTGPESPRNGGRRPPPGPEPLGAQPLVRLVVDGIEALGQARHLLVGRRVQLGERALAHRARRTVDDGRAPSLAEDLEEGERLGPHA